MDGEGLKSRRASCINNCNIVYPEVYMYVGVSSKSIITLHIEACIHTLPAISLILLFHALFLHFLINISYHATLDPQTLSLKSVMQLHVARGLGATEDMLLFLCIIMAWSR